MKTRKDIQIMRRAFHCASGILIATLYGAFLSHKQAVFILGFAASSLYVIEQIRVNYPQVFKKISFLTNYLIRAEEQLKESSMVPYVMAVLLCIITFPKVISLVAIYTLAIGDPLSAIIGIRFGRHHIVPEKSVEGSAAFFISSFFITYLIFTEFTPIGYLGALTLSSILASCITAFEMLPLKLDDNLTIPLVTALTLWLLTWIASIPVS